MTNRPSQPPVNDLAGVGQNHELAVFIGFDAADVRGQGDLVVVNKRSQSGLVPRSRAGGQLACFTGHAPLQKILFAFAFIRFCRHPAPP